MLLAACKDKDEKEEGGGGRGSNGGNGRDGGIGSNVTEEAGEGNAVQGWWRSIMEELTGVEVNVALLDWTLVAGLLTYSVSAAREGCVFASKFVLLFLLLLFISITEQTDWEGNIVTDETGANDDKFTSAKFSTGNAEEVEV